MPQYMKNLGSGNSWPSDGVTIACTVRVSPQ